MISQPTPFNPMFYQGASAQAMANGV